MTPVTERFVFRLPAPAERDPVPDLVRFAIGRYHRYTAPDPEWSVFTAWRVLDDDNGFFQVRLNYLSGRFVVEDQPPRRAVAALLDGDVPGISIIRLFDEVPDAAGPHTEPGVAAKMLVVGERQGRTPDDACTVKVRLAVSCLGPVKMDLYVSAIAERLVLRVPAPAEGILLLERVGLDLFPGPAVPLVIIANLLGLEGNPAGHEIGAVIVHGDLHRFATVIR